MTLDETQRKTLINRIVQEVLHRVAQQMPADEELTGTVVLITSYVPSPKSALSKIKKNYSGEITYIDFGTGFTAGIKQVMDANKAGEEAVIKKLASAANIILLAPKISLLQQVAEGSDDGFVQYLMVRSILWQRNVAVLLDFKTPNFKRNTFYERVITAVNALEEMGVRLLAYQCATYAKTQGLELVTEHEVLEAYKNNQTEIQCVPRAMITPLARDKAKELDIVIN